MQQSSLFGEATAASGETLEEIGRELLEKVKSGFPGKVFVLGTGNENADVVIVGESPGPPDATTGKPFSGPVGDLLRRIVASIKLSLDDCYLTNAVKFISQGDEVTSEIVAFFTPFLKREILSINPQLIIVLGNTPAKALLDKKQPISKIRGEFAEFQGIKVMPTFNPAYLLRDATKKREVWEDMKKVRSFLDGH